MSDTQSNFELNRIYDEVKQMGLLKNTQNIFILVLVYTVMITTMLSALLGGIAMQSYYGIEFIFITTMEALSKVYEALSKVYEALAKFCEMLHDTDTYVNNNNDNNNVEKPVKKPLIDETWCNVSVKNIINYEYEEVSEDLEDEAVENLEAESEVISEDSDDEVISEAKNEDSEEASLEAVASLEVIRAEVEEEILSLKKIEDLRAEEILN
jgi:hypothetical protein